VRAVTGEPSAAPHLAFEIRRAHFFNLHVEELLHGLLHHDLVGIDGDLETKRTLGFLLRDAFFGDQRPDQCSVDTHYSWPSFALGADFARVSLSFEAAACVKSTCVAPSSW